MPYCRVLVLVLWATVAPAAAQQLHVDIKDGRVNLEANAVPLRQILAEWAKVGGTQVVGVDKVSGPPLTLRLVDVPEHQALEIILRDVAGYIAAQRLVQPGVVGSIYDRILILPTSAAPSAIAASNPRLPNGANETGKRDAPAPVTEQANESQAGIGQHAPLPFPLVTPGEEEQPPVQGRLGRRADPGMVPVVVGPPPRPAGAPQPGPK